MLEGVRVLEVSHAVAGPTAAQILGDYGAEIIKIEKPGSGDIFRDVPGMGPTMFLAVNRGKKSVCLDLKSREGLDIFYELAAKSQVVIENLGPGVAENLGISYRKVRMANSRIVYCKIESFGSGPYQNVPAFDPILQAAVGIMSTTGFPPDHYARAGISVVDMASGMHAASGILAILLGQKKKGAEIRVSLYDAAAYFMSYWVSMFDLYGKNTSPLGSGHIFGAPYNLFKTKDSYVYIAIANDRTWEAFCNALSLANLQKDERFRTANERVSNKTVLESLVGEKLASLQTSEVEQALLDSGVPFGKFNTVKTLLEDRHFLGRKLLREYQHGNKSYRSIVNPAVVDGKRITADRTPPILGADTEKVLRRVLKIDSKRLRDLKKKGIV
jgi:crotonobetainyl-CoA:carnitine CoA-transferase CaiB-like acyl-CoA transferase